MQKFGLSALLFVCLFAAASAQSGPETRPSPDPKQKVRTVSIPISIYTKQELKTDQASEFVQVERIIVKEDKEEQAILSIRSVNETPLYLAILIQEDLATNFNLELKGLSDFIRTMPGGSRVMVAYLRGGTLQVRQKFTEDLERAASALRIVSSTAAAAPRNPFDSVIDALNRFDALPTGRRAILLVSDGVDVSQGFTGSSPGQSTDLQRAIQRAQRKSVPVFSIFSPSSLTEGREGLLVLNGQGSLQRLSDETGGRAFFQGTGAPVSFEPFYKDIRLLLNRQFLLTYLSTHMDKGYHRVEVTTTTPAIEIQYPRGYYYR
jgi:VWFA-related protein